MKGDKTQAINTVIERSREFFIVIASYKQKIGADVKRLLKSLEAKAKLVSIQVLVRIHAHTHKHFSHTRTHEGLDTLETWYGFRENPENP